MNAPMRDIQHSGVNGDDIKIFGGLGDPEGAFTIASSGAIGPNGYPVTFGNSYMQVVTWEPDGKGFKPVADAFVTYSQSTDPANPHFNDFTRAYSKKQWQRLPFRPDEVQAQKISEIQLSQ